MVKRSGKLNGSLKKDLGAARGPEPERFPGFVGLEKLPAIELFDAAQKRGVAAAHGITPVPRCGHHSKRRPEWAGLAALPGVRAPRKRRRPLVLGLSDGQRRAGVDETASRRDDGILFPMIPIHISLGSVRLGLLEADAVRTEPSPEGLGGELRSVADRLARNLTVEAVAEMGTVRAVRAMFRAWGLDPSKYRPSSEALLRRIAQGKGVYLISNIVDIVNLGSIETAWPYGCYDREKLRPPVTLRLGEHGEKYEGIGRRVWHLEGRPVLADAEGPFGAPISDSTRTQITSETRSFVATIFAPASSRDAAIEQALSRMAERLERWAGASGIHREILHGEAGEVA
jgi:DNA/RNA-binding domain of Phe-tRNA-synthetase-like protein